MKWYDYEIKIGISIKTGVWKTGTVANSLKI